MNYRSMNGGKVTINGQQTPDIYKKGEQKPVVRTQAPQYIDNRKDTPIQYLN
ncbi:hypothetical protein [Staphylococcus edaphicus]|uniref:Uncharacterized protein n=1 Tax=Staphylococcus edaphicus TaxID=1955013 RepID=A0ABY4QAK8_9STAP|nr:hypothetical protein [Staphylococcus edaphicus]UQW80441.1 hypothetical protein MNY58_07430 [Staphylococcus edaphicus]